MTDELRAINERIAEHWLGRLSPEQDEYVRHASVCIAQLTCSVKLLQRSVERFRRDQPKAPRVLELNRQYLRFARMAAKDALAHRPDMLIRLGITIEQALFLRDLSDDDLEHLALGFKCPIVRFPYRAFRRGARLHRQASQLHAASFVAARPEQPAEGSE